MRSLTLRRRTPGIRRRASGSAGITGFEYVVMLFFIPSLAAVSYVFYDNFFSPGR